MGVVGRELDREGPLEAILQVLRPLGHAQLFRPDGDVALLAGAVVVADQPPIALAAADRPADHDVGIVRLDRDVAALAAARLVPLGRRDGAVDRHAGQADRSVVLLGAVDPIGEAVVDGDVVHLGSRLVELGRPGTPAVEGDAGAAVVAVDHAMRVLRVDPVVVVVAVGRRHLGEGDAAVDRLPELEIEHPDGVGILRVGAEVVEVPGAPAQVALVAHALPGVAVVVGAEERAVLGLDDGPDAARFRCGGREADPSENALGQLGLPADLLPGVAAVEGAEEPAPRPAADQLPGPADRLP
ncbi:hypothetical protein HRbin26_01806 [bacterium HR26]|nr:hypothetical protein HRbin26_01806 [bacterium HR26]